ncbi:MAG: hypothetical protein GX066_09245 [Clostridiaceae bacterium]|nr:hypothetical protein [Clostridiaceae bacterium]
MKGIFKKRTLKKIAGGIAIFILIMALSTSALAAEIKDAAVTYDKSTNTVTVTGKISTGAGKQVTLLCLPIDEETGEVEGSDPIYIDQITTKNADGSFSVKFKMPDNAAGSYVVRISGTGVSQRVSVIFSVDEPSVLYGDVNGDGEIAAGDAILVLRNTVGLITFTDAQKIAADVNGDGEIAAGDAILILRYTVGLIDKFPVESRANYGGGN